jgi:hypothetical protein
MIGIMEKRLDNPINWEIIRQTIQEEKCLLILGPEAYVDIDNRKLEDRIGDFLKVDSNPRIRKYYPEDGLFLFRSEEDKTAIYYTLRQFFQEDGPGRETLFRKIARIPFHFILNLTPDQHLYRLMQEMNLRCKFDFYWKNRTATSTDKLPTRQAPLLYNMLGSIEERDSLVLTYQDLFDYFDSILGARSMPEELKSILAGIDNFIFLGVKFECWHMQLLLRLLAKYNRRDSFLRYASSLNVSEQVATFCSEQFRIHFVKEKIDGFIDALYQKFDEAQSLRVLEEQTASPLEKVIQDIKMAKTGEAFDGMQTFLAGHLRIPDDLHDDFVTLHSRYNRLNRRITSGVISFEDADIAMNQITESFLNMVGWARNYE